MSAVDPEAGRRAADIIRAAVRDHVPVLRVSKAAAMAGITDVGWHRAIKTGRGYESTFIAMARIAGVEPQVREVLGLEPLDDANVIPMASRPPGFERSIAENPRLSEHERQILLIWYRDAGGREYMDLLARARQA